ncbi:MAG: secretin N-terminal domain-containing protein, partial [Thermodesulfobacteriota bacterium]
MDILKRVFLGCLLLLSLGSFVPAFASAASGSSGKIAMNFQDVEISTVVRFISETTGRNFIYDDRLKGKITIIAPKELSGNEAFDLFVSVMELKGFTVINTGSAYRVSPLAMVKQGPVTVSKGKKRPARANELYMARLIPLEHLTPGELLPVLTPMVSRQGYMAAFGTSNSILILDTARNIDKILKVVGYLDVKGTSSPSELVMLKYAMAEDMVETLNKYEAGSVRTAPGLGAQPMTQIASKKAPIAVKRLNAVIIIGNDAQRKRLKELITLLDVQPSEVRSRINVYYLENADAEELAKTLERVMDTAPGNADAVGGNPAKPMQVKSRFTDTVVITPDIDTNSLIIMARPDDYNSLVSVIKQLDRRPSQVYVEAMIVEVKVDKARDLGTKWRIAADENGAPV